MRHSESEQVAEGEFLDQNEEIHHSHQETTLVSVSCLRHSDHYHIVLKTLKYIE